MTSIDGRRQRVAIGQAILYYISYTGGNKQSFIMSHVLQHKILRNKYVTLELNLEKAQIWVKII